MRTTLSIADDVFAAAKELADRKGKSVGEIISELARQALSPKRSRRRKRNGVLLLPVRPGSRLVTTELVNRLRDELP